MAIPANLFVDTPEVEDVSLTQLNNDPEQWPEEIIQKLKERIPASQGIQVMVKFMKKDEENGVATGSIVLNSMDGKAAIIPVIIKDFMLYPLDVMIAKQKLLPLTPDYFASIFGNGNDVFLRIEEFPTYGGLGRFEDANLWNATYPPALGRYAYASSGQYPILEEIADTINGAEFKDFLLKNAEIAGRFHKLGHKEIIKKLANLKPVNQNEFRQGVENLVPHSIALLRREGPNKYTIVSTSDEVFHPALETADRLTMMECVSKISDHAEDDMNDVDQNGEKLLSPPAPNHPVFLAGADKEVPVEAKEYGHYHVKKMNGVGVDGIVIPQVIGFDQKPTDLKVFMGKTMSTIQPGIWGVRQKNSRFKLEAHDPKPGQTGVFVYQPDDSHALCTVPVTIKSVVQDSCTKLKVVDLMGATFLLRLDEYEKLQRIAVTEPGVYTIPKSMKWVPMEGFEPVTNSAEDYATKTAAVQMTNHPVKIIDNGYNTWAIRGVDKYASACGWDKTNLTAGQASFLLRALGMGSEKIAESMKIAHRKGNLEVHGLNFPVFREDKIAAARPRAEKIVKQARALKRNLTKEASYLENSQTVDAMLSLNFVSPDNISKFIGKIPQFKSSISGLASCLLASRLGIKEIPEQSAATAMNRLIEVVDGLEKLRATQTVGI